MHPSTMHTSTTPPSYGAFQPSPATVRPPFEPPLMAPLPHRPLFEPSLTANPGPYQGNQVPHSPHTHYQPPATPPAFGTYQGMQLPPPPHTQYGLPATPPAYGPYHESPLLHPPHTQFSLPPTPGGSRQRDRQSLFRTLEKSAEVVRYDPTAKTGDTRGSARLTRDVAEYIRYVRLQTTDLSAEDQLEFLIAGTPTGTQVRLRQRLTQPLGIMTPLEACVQVLRMHSANVGDDSDSARSTFRNVRMPERNAFSENAYSSFKDEWLTRRTEQEIATSMAAFPGSERDRANEVREHVLQRIAQPYRDAYKQATAYNADLTINLTEEKFWTTLDLVAKQLRETSISAEDTSSRKTRFQAFAEDRPRVEPERSRPRRELTPGPERDLCQNCYRPGHSEADCPRREMQCYSCGETGHFASKCPNSPAANYGTRREQYGSRVRGRSRERDGNSWRSRDSSRERSRSRGRSEERDRDRTPHPDTRRHDSDRGRQFMEMLFQSVGANLPIPPRPRGRSSSREDSKDAHEAAAQPETLYLNK